MYFVRDSVQLTIWQTSEFPRFVQVLSFSTPVEGKQGKGLATYNLMSDPFVTVFWRCKQKYLLKYEYETYPEQYSVNSNKFGIIFHQINSNNLIIQSLFWTRFFLREKI